MSESPEFVDTTGEETVSNDVDTAGEERVLDGEATADGDDELNYFSKPSSENIKAFFAYHPRQPRCKDFQPEKVYYRSDGSKRNWLIFSSENRKFFCSVCLCFSDIQSPFVDGMYDLKHIYQAIDRHENSKMHDHCVSAYMHHKAQKTVKDLVNVNLSQKRRQLVEKRREIFKRIIDVVRTLGKSGSAVRGKRNEAAYSLKYEELNHGNFLETIMLLAKYDPLLSAHIDEAAAKSQALHDKGSKQGGGTYSFLSKTTVNYIIEAVTDLMKEKISAEIRKAGMYSIQLDTTQDVSITEQCSVIARFVNGNATNAGAQERLIAIFSCSSTTGQSFVEYILKVLKELNLNVKNCISNATDGASNMQGKDKGFSTLFQKECEKVGGQQLHVWCYAHVLNLVIKDVTSMILEVSILFSLLNETFALIRESYKRMDIWRELVPRIGLGCIGETRWWAKAEALKKIFGESSHNSGLLPQLIIALHKISKSETMKPEIRAKADGLKQNFLKFKTICTAQIFLQIFERTTPLSNYLQTKGADILKVHNMVQATLKEIQEKLGDFEEILISTNSFISWVNEKLDETDEYNFSVESEFPEIRIRRKKRMFSYEAQDEPAADGKEEFRINVFTRAKDIITRTMTDRFVKHANLWADLSCLDPKRFNEIKENLPNGALAKLFSYIQPFTTESTTLETFRGELKDFANKWDQLKRTLDEDFERIFGDGDDSSTDDDVSDGGDSSEPGRRTTEVKRCETCKECPACCFAVIKDYNLYKNAYPTLYLAYKFILTMSIVQVSCERCFSALKFIKNRLRSTLTEDHLESFMLMYVEKDVLVNLTHEEILSVLITKSPLIRKLLT